MIGRHIRAVSIIALSVGAALWSGQALAYQSVMLRDSGPASNRVNIVILGDGYLASELVQLETDARTALASIDQEPFYREYASFINVKLVLTSSASSTLGNGTPGNTLFGLYFGCEGMARLICIGNNEQVATVLNQDAPEWDYVAIIANSTAYGGSGGQFVTFTRDANSTQVFIHETAHQYGGLADEYSDAYPAYPVCGAECPEPNVTPVGSVRQNLKWNYWIEQTTPLPTPDTTPYLGVIGAFEGARYMATGLYRPRHTCRMRATNQKFCEICAEAHVLETYRMVNGFDSITPGGTQISINASSPLQLAVAHPQTASGSVRYSWHIDGEVFSSVGPALALSANALSTGTHSVEVQLADETMMVGRDDALLHKRAAWTVSVIGSSGTGGAGGSAPATGGTSSMGAGGAFLTGGMPAVGGTSATGGGTPATGGTSSAARSTLSAMGGASAHTVVGTGDAIGGALQAGGRSPQELGGSGNPTGVASTSEPVAAPSSQGGSQVGSQSGGTGRSTRNGGESSEAKAVGCSCRTPQPSSSVAPAWLLGAMLLAPLRRRRRRA